MVLQQIVSGGQSGVDRAALDAAIALGIPAGGWCPRGRIAEDGTIPERYPLRETHSARYALRTRWNVRDSDATLLLTRKRPTGGTALTAAWARRLQRPLLVQNPEKVSARQLIHVRQWLREQHVRVLNIAGPRESTAPGIYAAALEFLRQLFNDWKQTEMSKRL